MEPREPGKNSRQQAKCIQPNYPFTALANVEFANTPPCFLRKWPENVFPQNEEAPKDEGRGPGDLGFPRGPGTWDSVGSPSSNRCPRGPGLEPETGGEGRELMKNEREQKGREGNGEGLDCKLAGEICQIIIIITPPGSKTSV